MKGTVKSMPPGKMFGFIKAVNGEHFFHRSDNLELDWVKLESDYQVGKVIEVEFDPMKSPKGPRAVNVRRLSE